jgi:hypothetical protein
MVATLAVAAAKGSEIATWATYVQLVISDAELAAAVAGCAHWELVGAAAALYAVSGSTVSVRVQRVRQPTKREVYMASIIRDGPATSTMPFGEASAAVDWA